MSDVFHPTEHVRRGARGPIRDLDDWRRVCAEAANDPDAFWVTETRRRQLGRSRSVPGTLSATVSPARSSACSSCSQTSARAVLSAKCSSPRWSAT